MRTEDVKLIRKCYQQRIDDIAEARMLEAQSDECLIKARKLKAESTQFTFKNLAKKFTISATEAERIIKGKDNSRYPQMQPD